MILGFVPKQKTNPEPDRRRFDDEDRKPWTAEERADYEAKRSRIAPFIRDLTTPAKAEKKKDFLSELLG